MPVGYKFAQTQTCLMESRLERLEDKLGFGWYRKERWDALVTYQREHGPWLFSLPPRRSQL